jgi:ribosome-associated translation inhibitor RaiA
MTEKPDFPDKPDFPIEYHTEIPLLSVELQEEIETRLIKLAEGRSDMTGAAVAVTQPAQRDNPYIYQARILVYRRPDDVVAVEKSDTLQNAVKGALNAVERKVREERKKLGEHWKRADLPGNPGAAEDPPV